MQEEIASSAERWELLNSAVEPAAARSAGVTCSGEEGLWGTWDFIPDAVVFSYLGTHPCQALLGPLTSAPGFLAQSSPLPRAAT